MTKKKNDLKNDFIKRIAALDLGASLTGAFSSVERELFFEPFFKDKFNGFDPIPIGMGEYSDDVELLAGMLKILSPKKNWNVLEVGTGSGYSTAVISQLVKKITTIEFHEKLALDAKKRLIDNGFFNIKFMAGDCSELDDRAGIFDAAIIHAGCIHSPYAVLNLLKPDGVAVFAMGPVHMQQITFYKNIVEGREANPFARYKFYSTCNIPSIRGIYGNTNPGIDIFIEKGR